MTECLNSLIAFTSRESAQHHAADELLERLVDMVRNVNVDLTRHRHRHRHVARDLHILNLFQL